MANASTDTTEPTETTAPDDTTAGTETTGVETTAGAETTAAAETTASVEGTEGGDAGAAPVDLSGICPETVVIQTDWFPESEHGWLYEMVGDDPSIDASALTVTGPLVAGGVDTGVDIQIRTGGPALGTETVSSRLYSDDDILLGYVYTDEAIQFSDQFPTVAIFSGMEKNPQMIMWDPATYPDVESIADLGEAGVKIRYFEGAAYMDYFAQNGILSPDQLDSSYTGSPEAFVAAEGADAQQGFGSAEPYIYENEVDSWSKPVSFQYINDAGWNNYGESIATKPENLETYADCFTALVPILQQSSVDFVSDPAETIDLILEAVTAFDTFWVYSPGVAAYGVETMIGDGLVGNGPNETLGDFDLDRVNGLIEIAIPVYTSLGQVPAEGLTAEDVVTNEFIDPSIGLPADIGGEPDGSGAPGASAAPEDTDTAADTTTGG